MSTARDRIGAALVGDLRRMKSRKQGDLDGLNSGIAEAQETVSRANARIAALSTKRDALVADIAEIDTRISALSSR